MWVSHGSIDHPLSKVAPPGRLIGVSWSDDQILICIVQDGTIYRYNVHAGLVAPNVSMGKGYNLNNVGLKVSIEISLIEIFG
ncbi:hypothetical protein YC2023_064419 [Brassica napus]